MYRGIQVLRNAMGMSDFPENIVMKVYGSMLLALRGGWWVGVEQISKKKSLRNT